MTKKIVESYIPYFDAYGMFHGMSIERAIENLIKLKQSYSNSELVMNIQPIGYDDDGYEINVSEIRLETDAEYEKRLMLEAKSKAKVEKLKVEKEEKDRKLYERLKKKFEGS